MEDRESWEPASERGSSDTDGTFVKKLKKEGEDKIPKNKNPLAADQKVTKKRVFIEEENNVRVQDLTKYRFILKDLSKKIEDLEKKVEDLRKKVEEYEKQIEDLKNYVAGLMRIAQ